MRPSDVKSDECVAVNTRLSEAAATSEPVQLILVLSGKVRRVHSASGNDRWRMRVRGQPVTFHAEAVIACTPVRKPGRPAVPT